MVIVLFLFFCFVSPVFLDDVPIHRNLTRKSPDFKPIKLLPSNFQHVYLGNEQSRPQTNLKADEQLPSSKCPNTDLLLNILTILTKSLPKKVVDPQKLQDVISTIKVILTKASVNNDINNLYNEVKVLKDQLETISNKEDEEVSLRKESAKKLKAKLSLQYDVPDKCEYILYALVNFINNAYAQVAKYCLVTGNCKVDDIPTIKYDTAGQTKQPITLEQLIQKNPIYSSYLEGASQDTNPKYKNIYDLIKSLQNYKPNSGSGETNLQNLLGNLNRNSNNVPNKSQKSPLKLYPEWLLYDSTTQKSIDNPLSLQDIYAAIKDLSPDEANKQDYIKILTEKLKNVDIPNKGKENIEKPTDSDILNLLQTGKKQPKVTDKQTNAGIKLPPPYDSLLKHPDQLSNNDLYQLLYAMKSQPDQIGKILETYPQYFGYVTPDTLNITPDKTKQYVQLPDLSHFSVTNQDKLNTMPNQNEVVELTYMLKRPKLAYEPLYYVKYRVPYSMFVYNLQKLLVKNPFLRNQPRKLYQELLMLSNVTEASGDLKNLEQEELVKLIATNGTLVTAKIVAENKTLDQLNEVLNTTSNLSPETTKTNVEPSLIEKLLKLSSNDSLEHDFSPRIGLSPYYSYGYSKPKSLFQTNLNYNPGIVSSSSSNVYGRPSMYAINKNIPSNVQTYSVYKRGYPKVG